MSFSDEVREILKNNKQFDKSAIKVGDDCLGVGLDDDCLPCICYGRIEEKCKDGTYTYYSKETDIRIIFREKDLKDCYPDTPSNRAIIKTACQVVINKWREAVDRQFGRK